jgi:hypothetical protein
MCAAKVIRGRVLRWHPSLIPVAAHVLEPNIASIKRAPRILPCFMRRMVACRSSQDQHTASWMVFAMKVTGSPQHVCSKGCQRGVLAMASLFDTRCCTCVGANIASSIITSGASVRRDVQMWVQSAC